MDNQANSYTEFIKLLKHRLTVIGTSALYLPIFIKYDNTVKAINNLGDEDDYKKLIHTLDQFSPTEIQNMIRDYSKSVSTFLMTGRKNDVIKKDYPNLKNFPTVRLIKYRDPSLSRIVDRHRLTTDESTKMQTKLLSALKPLREDIREMKRLKRKITNNTDQINGKFSASKFLQALQGGFYGASVGSIIPGVGTAAGAAAGIFAMDYKQTRDKKSKKEMILESSKKYMGHAERIIQKMVENVERVHGQFDQLGEALYKKVPRKIYTDIRSSGKEENKIIYKFYRSSKEKIKYILDQEIDAETDSSTTLRDIVNITYDTMQINEGKI